MNAARVRGSSDLGFTLLELLIAVAITAVIVVLLSRVFGATAAQWQAADQRIDAFRDARTALHVIARDLGRANVSANSGMLALKEPGPADDYAQEAFAVTPTANSGNADLCAVGYYTEWNASAKTFTLKRQLRESNAIIGDLQTLNFSALYTKAPALAEDVAAYVWDLRFYVGLEEVPVPLGNAGPTSQWRWIEVRFKAMSPNAAKRLRDSAMTQGDWNNPAGDIYKRLVLPNEQQFVTRVVLQHNRR
jgi:prepilin-type N-terminal cleavage/methylation domain-containing protein